MELYVYSSDMELQGIVEKIASLIWTRRYWSCGEFKLLVPFTDAGEEQYHYEARRRRSGTNPLCFDHEEFAGAGGNRGSRKVPDRVDREANNQKADYHERHNAEHSIPYCTGERNKSG